MPLEGDRHAPIGGPVGLFVQDFSRAVTSKLLLSHVDMVLSLSLTIGTGDGGQGGRGGNVGCDNVALSGNGNNVG